MMKTYVFNLPDGYDLSKCFVMFDKGKIIVDKPVDHLMFERVTSEIKELKEDNKDV